MALATCLRALAAPLAAALLVAIQPGGALAFLLPEERAQFDMSGYAVRDRDASFVDVPARMELLRATDDPLLALLKDRLEMGVSCAAYKASPILADTITVPAFYDNPDQWRIATEPLLAFEEMMSQLSGSWIATGDPYFANCLVDILEAWAKADALHDFKFSKARSQAWYAIESMIFSAALAFSTVTGEVDIAPERRETIDAWFNRIARHHFTREGAMPSCCNNHFYRRSLYMTIVGVVTGDDEMFQTGLEAPIAALHDLDENGSLRLAMQRGWRALHYQNYSLLYLVTTMQVAHRQGYDLFTHEVNGRTFADAVRFLMLAMADPYNVDGLPPGEQDMSFTNDNQYFSWMEIWLSHFDDPKMERFVRLHRPVYNRGAGGHATLLFKNPESPDRSYERQLANLEMDRMSAAEIGALYPYLEKWRRAR